MTTITIDLSVSSREMIEQTAAFLTSVANLSPSRKPAATPVVTAAVVEERKAETATLIADVIKVAAPSFMGDAILDADGLPWDERIHSESKTRLSDGTWRRRRNTPDEVYNMVVQELRQRMSSDVAKVVAITDAARTAQAAAPSALPSMLVPPPPPAPASPAIVDAPPPPPAAPEVVAPTTVGATPRSFDELMALVTDVIQDGNMDEDAIKVVLGAQGVVKLGDLKTESSARIGAVFAALHAAAV